MLFILFNPIDTPSPANRPFISNPFEIIFAEIINEIPRKTIEQIIIYPYS